MAADPDGGEAPVGSKGSRVAPHSGNDVGVVVGVVVVRGWVLDVVVLVRTAPARCDAGTAAVTPQPAARPAAATQLSTATARRRQGTSR